MGVRSVSVAAEGPPQHSTLRVHWHSTLWVHIRVHAICPRAAVVAAAGGIGQPLLEVLRRAVKVHMRRHHRRLHVRLRVAHFQVELIDRRPHVRREGVRRRRRGRGGAGRIEGVPRATLPHHLWRRRRLGRGGRGRRGRRELQARPTVDAVGAKLTRAEGGAGAAVVARAVAGGAAGVGARLHAPKRRRGRRGGRLQLVKVDWRGRGGRGGRCARGVDELHGGAAIPALCHREADEEREQRASRLHQLPPARRGGRRLEQTSHAHDPGAQMSARWRKVQMEDTVLDVLFSCELGGALHKLAAGGGYIGIHFKEIFQHSTVTSPLLSAALRCSPP